MAREEVRSHTEEPSPLVVNLLVANRGKVYVNSEDGKEVFVHGFVDLGETEIDVLGDGEVEENIEAAEGEVVEEAEEVYAGGS